MSGVASNAPPPAANRDGYCAKMWKNIKLNPFHRPVAVGIGACIAASAYLSVTVLRMKGLPSLTLSSIWSTKGSEAANGLVLMPIQFDFLGRPNIFTNPYLGTIFYTASLCTVLSVYLVGDRASLNTTDAGVIYSMAAAMLLAAHKQGTQIVRDLKTKGEVQSIVSEGGGRSREFCLDDGFLWMSLAVYGLTNVNVLWRSRDAAN